MAPASVGSGPTPSARLGAGHHLKRAATGHHLRTHACFALPWHRATTHAYPGSSHNSTLTPQRVPGLTAPHEPPNDHTLRHEPRSQPNPDQAQLWTCQTWHPAGTQIGRPFDRGATSSVRAEVRGRGAATASGPQAPRHRATPSSTSPSWPTPSGPSRPDATSQAQVGRVHPNHPAALRRGCEWGPTPLSSITTPQNPQEERTQVRVAAQAARRGGF